MNAKTLLPMPLLITIFTCLILLPAQLTAQTSSNPDFEIAPNGVTLICDDADVGDTTDINNQTFTKRNRSQIEDLLNVDENNPELANTYTSGITDMSILFKNSTYNQDIRSWDVSQVTDMRAMFRFADAFNRDLESWIDLLLEGESSDEETIVTEARENWHPDKLKIQRSKFFDAIEWLIDNNLVSKGVGTHTVRNRNT